MMTRDGAIIKKSVSKRSFEHLCLTWQLQYLVDPRAPAKWRRIFEGLSQVRDGRSLLKISTPLPLRETYRLVPLSARSISMNRFFKPYFGVHCSFLYFFSCIIVINLFDPPYSSYQSLYWSTLQSRKVEQDKIK